MRLIAEERYLTDEAKNGKDTARQCYYLFDYNHPAACVPKKHKLSVGVISVIM